MSETASPPEGSNKFVRVTGQMRLMAAWNAGTALLYLAVIAIFFPEERKALPYILVFAVIYVLVFILRLRGRLQDVYRGNRPGFFLTPLPEGAEIVSARSRSLKIVVSGLTLLIPLLIVFLVIAVVVGSAYAFISGLLIVFPTLLAGMAWAQLNAAHAIEKETLREFYSAVTGMNLFSRQSRLARRFVYYSQDPPPLESIENS